MDAYYCTGAPAVVHGVRGTQVGKYRSKKSEGLHAFRFLFKTWLLVYLSTDQLPLPHTLHLLDRDFSLHRRLSIRQFLNIHQFHRTARPGITGAASLVVHCQASFRVNGPACIVRAVCTFKDVTITAHFTCVLCGRQPYYQTAFD